MHVVILTDLAENGMPQGGVQRSVVALARGLAGSGARVDVLAPSSRSESSVDDSLGFRLTRLPMLTRYQILRGFRPWIREVAGALERLKPDVVHGQGLLHNGVAAVAWRDAPSVVTAHGDPIVDARWGYRPAVHALAAPLLRHTVRRVLQRADRVLNVTPDWRVNCVVEPRHHTFVPNPVEPVFFETEAHPEGKRVAFFGGPRRIKGADILLEAWPGIVSAHPEAALTLYGFGDERSGTGAIGEDPSMPSVTFRGAVSKNEVARAMASSAMVVVSSRYEVAPMVVAEAWAVGVPLLATAVGGLPGMARDAAMLVAPNAEALAEGATHLLHGGPEVDRMITRGGQLVASQHPDEVISAHLAAYEETLRESSS